MKAPETNTSFRREGELPFGYENRDEQKRKQIHTRFVFGNRPTGADLIAIGNKRESQVQTQMNLMLVQAALIEFGTLGRPTLTMLLSLNRIDRDVLVEEHDLFIEESREGRTGEILSNDTVRLAFGLEVEGVRFDTFRFGHLLTGYDEAEIDRSGTVSWERLCRLLAKQITGVSQSNGKKKLGRDLTLDDFAVMDAEDVTKLQEAQETWLDSFRRTRKTVERNSGVGDAVSKSLPAGVESDGDRESADATA